MSDNMPLVLGELAFATEDAKAGVWLGREAWLKVG